MLSKQLGLINLTDREKEGIGWVALGGLAVPPHNIGLQYVLIQTVQYSFGKDEGYDKFPT